jgi:hypothetical protein
MRIFISHLTFSCLFPNIPHYHEDCYPWADSIIRFPLSCPLSSSVWKGEQELETCGKCFSERELNPYRNVR